MEAALKRVMTIKIADFEQVRTETRAVARRLDRGADYQGEFHYFENLALLFTVFTPRRWELIQKLQVLGPSSLRGLARALGRDVKRVHEDAAAMLKEGIIERNADKKLFVPFERIHIDVNLVAAAEADQAAA